MTHSEGIDRREFTLASVLALLSGITILIEEACGGGGSSPSSPSPTPTPAPSSEPGNTGDVVGQISANHGHVAVITGAEMTAGNAVTLDIRGTATHTHSASISADDIATIKGGGKVSKVSTVAESHDHTVTFSPGTPGSGPGY
jgi:hypothetical protein